MTDISASPISSPGGGHVHIDYSTEDETTDTLHAYKGSRHLESEDDLTTDREIKVYLQKDHTKIKYEYTKIFTNYGYEYNKIFLKYS